MSEKVKNKLVMVNSFKGGTGKTSVALAQCIHNWKVSTVRKADEDSETDRYKNIYFIDIDRLGTSLAYSLFPEGEKIHYFEEYPEKDFETVCNEVKLVPAGDCNFYAVLLNPVARRKQDYVTHGRMQQHVNIANSIFVSHLLSFMEKCIKQEENSLFVIDCSPGLSDMEVILLDKFYSKKKSWNLSMEELYVTTFDSSQIRKTIECLNDNHDLLFREKRQVSIVLNDLYNCKAIKGNGEDSFFFEWKKTAGKILEKLKDNKDVKIRFKQYEAGQMKSCIIGNERVISNNIDAYVLQQEYWDGYISADRKDGE